ncbi:MAG: FGGY family carbohydrate kinase [Clostridia bacterium]
MALLGIDVGTSGVKASAIDQMGKTLAYAHGAYALHTPEPGVFELSPDEVWRATGAVVSQVAAQADLASDPISALCVSSLGESFVLFDDEGTVMGCSPMYFDRRGGEALEELLSRADEATWQEHTGLYPHIRQTLPKLMAWGKQHPARMEKVRKLHFFADYILSKFGAPHVTDASLAATSMMLDVNGCTWWDQAIKWSGMDAGIFPQVRRSGTDLGTINPGVAEQLGLKHTVRLILGGHDQMMCAVGAGIFDSATAANSMGTTDAVTPIMDRLSAAPALLRAGFRISPYAVRKGMYYSSAFNLNGGALISWFHQLFLGKDKMVGDVVYREMEASMREEPTSLILLPHFCGRQDAKGADAMTGAITGLTYEADRATLYKALLEGQAFEIKMWLDRFEEIGGKIECLHVMGGAARSDKNLQLRADIFKKTLKRLDNPEAGVLGDAMVAGVAMGAFSSLEEAGRRLVKTGRRFEPNLERHACYQERFCEYLRQYARLS